MAPVKIPRAITKPLPYLRTSECHGAVMVWLKVQTVGVHGPASVAAVSTTMASGAAVMSVAQTLHVPSARRAMEEQHRRLPLGEAKSCALADHAIPSELVEIMTGQRAVPSCQVHSKKIRSLLNPTRVLHDKLQLALKKS